MAISLLLAAIFHPHFRRKLDEWLTRIHSADPRQQRHWKILFLVFVAHALAFLGVYKHNSLQSHTHDLGIFLNVVWNLAHGNGWYDPIIRVQSFLGDHWSVVLGLFAPIMRLWADARPFFIVQGWCFALTAAGLMALGEKFLSDKKWIYFIPMLLLMHPYLHNISKFDFHPEAMGMPLLAWGLYFFLTDRPKTGFFLLSLTWFVKEDWSLVTLGIAVALFLDSRHRKVAVVLGISSLAVFFLTVGYLLPHFLNSPGDYTHMARYGHLGRTPHEILTTIIHSPHRVLWHVLGYKETWLVSFLLLLPFYWLPLFKGWRWLLLATVIFWAPHAISLYKGQRELLGPYSASVLVLLAVGSVMALTTKSWIHRIGFMPLFLVMVINWAFGVPAYTKPVSKQRIDAFHSIIKLIPADASLNAQGDLGPHVCFRKEFTMFPEMNNEDYVLLELAGNTWPLERYEFEGVKRKMLPPDKYREAHIDHGFVLYERIK